MFEDFTADDAWTIGIAALAGVTCAVPGTFMVLRRMSMMADAISHTVLPGIAIAFLIVGSRAYLPMLAGAAVVGVCTALLTQVLHRWGRVEGNAAMGVVFTSLFALGLVLIEFGAHAVDLDPGCVLYGNLEFAAWDTVTLAGFDLPRAVVVLGGVLLLDLILLAAVFKELRAVCFDADFARAVGIRADAIHLGLMAVVAITTVAAFELVGSIMVVALLIVPGATAWLWSQRLAGVVWLAVLLGALAGPLGFALAVWGPSALASEALPMRDTGIAGGIAVASGLLFLGSWLVAPRGGLVPRAWRRRQLRRRRAMEDVLGLLYRLGELDGDVAPATDDLVPTIAEALHQPQRRVLRALQRARARGLAFAAGGRWCLTDVGRRRGRAMVRSHRLWETYLYRRFGLREDHLHAPADRLEHLTDPVLEEAMLADLGHPDEDPHGRPMP